jgi:hypothetical protein
MRQVYEDLPQLDPGDIDDLFQMARGDVGDPPTPFRQMAQLFFRQGQVLLGYGAPPRCGSAQTVLELNREI